MFVFLGMLWAEGLISYSDKFLLKQFTVLVVESFETFGKSSQTIVQRCTKRR